MLNSNIKSLISAVADNDLQKAKAHIKVIIADEKAACNYAFVTSVYAKLNTPSMNWMELPQNIKGMLIMEDVSVSFNADRYVLVEDDQKIADKVLSIWATNTKLSELGINYLNSVLLYGESGCGKSMLGKYVAYKAGLPFAYLNFSNLVSSYLGKTGSNISAVFDHIAKTKCVFMLDEMDAVGLARGNDREVGEMSRVVIALMQCLDRLDNGTIVIGATNRDDIIDKALKRRFAIHHKMDLPSFETRFKIAERYLQTIPDAIIDDYYLNVFASQTDGYSCARLVNALIGRIVQCLVGGERVNLQGVDQWLVPLNRF